MMCRSTSMRQQAILAVLVAGLAQHLGRRRSIAAQDALADVRCRSAFLPGVAEEDLSLPCSVRALAGLGVERPFTIWDLGGVNQDPVLLLRPLTAICGPGGHRPVYVSNLCVQAALIVVQTRTALIFRGCLHACSRQDRTLAQPATNRWKTS